MIDKRFVDNIQLLHKQKKYIGHPITKIGNKGSVVWPIYAPDLLSKKTFKDAPITKRTETFETGQLLQLERIHTSCLQMKEKVCAIEDVRTKVANILTRMKIWAMI